jgi:hypothetical protein
MKFLRKLFGLQPAKAASAGTHSQLASSMSQQSRVSTSTTATRRELLGTALRDTLGRQGIPAAWLSAEMLLSTSRNLERGIHLRLHIRHWDTRLLAHSVALQNAFIVRLLASDPLASEWLMGISWQFDLTDESACPPMPPPGWWTANAEPTHGSPGRKPEPEPELERERQLEEDEARASADVRSDLERLFAVRDAELELNSQRSGATEATQPMFLKTQPMGPEDLQSLGRDPSIRQS